MTRAIFALAILLMLAVNIFLFRENRRLESEKDNLFLILEKNKGENKDCVLRLSALSVFFSALDNPQEEAQYEFETAVMMIGSDELAREYELMKKSESEDKMIKFCRKISNYEQSKE